MSKIEISGLLAALVALMGLAACGGGSASASGSVAVSEDGVSGSATASVPGATVTAEGSHSTYGGTEGTYHEGGTYHGTTAGGWAPAPTGTCVEDWVHMPILINFPTGGTHMDTQSRVVLQELVRSAQARPDLRAVRVEGHADRCGREANNMVLSQQRAEVVAAELVALGVPRERITTIGFGSQHPRANDDCTPQFELSRAVNRRVEFSLLVCR